MNFAGFFFLFILILQIAMAAFGYILEPTPKHYESDAKLLKFSESPKNFKISIGLALIEHFSIIILAIMLFIAFSLFNLILGIIWLICRIGEGSIQTYIEKDYWELLNIAKKYSISNGTEKKTFLDSYHIILQTKSSRFAYAMICWSIGTFTYSILFVIYPIGALPIIIIGWLGIVSSVLIGFVDVIKLVKPDFKVYDTLSSIGGLLAILFEVFIGIWLLFFP
jgi:hypothetical protein